MTRTRRTEASGSDGYAARAARIASTAGVARAARAVGVAALLALCACSSSPPTRFYELLPVEGERAAGSTRIRVSSVQVPAGHDRPQLVLRGEGHETTLAEFDRWLEPLSDGMQRVLALDLAARLGEERVGAMGNPLAVTNVNVVFERLELSPGRTSIATVNLLFVPPSGRDTWTRHATLEVATGPSPADVPAAVSEMLARIADLIVAEID